MKTDSIDNWQRHLICGLLCFGLVGCGLEETTHRSDKPLSLAAAGKDVWVSSLPFPPSTSDVYYAFHAGGMQEMEFYVRFTVDPDDLDKAVNQMLSHHDSTTHEAHSYASAPIAAAPGSRVESFLLPMPWWNPGGITDGYFRGTSKGQLLYLWVDVARHTIYLRQTD